MPLSKSIKDICIPLAEYPHLQDTASLKDAFTVLREAFTTGKRYRHILVLNAKGQLTGILGMRDILRGLFPDYLRTKEHPRHQDPIPDFPALTLIWAETCQSQCPAAAENPIKGFMGSIPAKVNIDDPLTKAAYLLVVHDISMLPVVEGERLVGVVRMIDVFNEAAKLVLHD
ncbi:CBS domain protein [Sulfuritortus calidifontis]|uniref:CBS domain protein n=1 Tax=Sulfuritortus calidifontis TaxID=1914471 RepID=A0A4R3JW93_9PROT|nr:CBS domain-containing protein [Sulfuritortus calidifontis]TCS72375.1 CBS domain protein [Sulfuritortus calidifontis]